MTDFRKLAAIMFTDMVGFSALTQRNEALALKLLDEHQQLLRSIFARHDGREVKATGDGFLVEFASALQALRCALAIQTAMVQRNSSAAPGRRIELRIGLHLGDVEVRDGDVFGDGVNIAARIEPLAEAGGICVTGAVFDQVRNKIEEPLVRLENPELKNIQLPIDVYRVVLPWTPEASDPEVRTHAWSRLSVRVGAMASVVAVVAALLVWWAVARSPDSPSASHVLSAAVPAETVLGFRGRSAIAVLPFDNLSPDPAEAFFADGLADDLITRLSTWRAFPVIARNSSFQYRGGNQDLKRVGAELGARYLVEGSVRRDGDRIRVTAQLIDAISGQHVWAETYDRKVTDVFALQDEISGTIAASVAGDVTSAEGKRARQRGTENLDAWSFYQLGVTYLDRLTPEANAEARRLLARAVELDPRFATALAQLAIADAWSVILGWREASEQWISDLLGTTRRAVELDARDPVAHDALAGAYLLSGDVRNGLDSARRAIDLNPSMPEAWVWLGFAQLLGGDPEACIAANRTAQQLNPQGPMVSMAYDNMALAYWETERYEASLEAARRLIAARPTYYWGYLYIALNSVALGHPDEARAAIADARRIQPDLSLEMIQRGLGVARPKIDARRNAALRQAGLQ